MGRGLDKRDEQREGGNFFFGPSRRLGLLLLLHARTTRGSGVDDWLWLAGPDGPTLLLRWNSSSSGSGRSSLGSLLLGSLKPRNVGV